MNFKAKYKLRNNILRALYWCFSFTSLLTAYTFIRWQKFVYYGDWILEGFDRSQPDHCWWVVKNELGIYDIAIYWCFLIALATDLILRKSFVKIK